MSKRKRKLSAAEKRRRKEYVTIFLNGKQKRVKRPATIDGIDVDELVLRNAEPIWLHQNEMWEYMEPMHAEDSDDSVSALPLGEARCRRSKVAQGDERDDDEELPSGRGPGGGRG